MTARRSRLAAYGWIEQDGLVLLSKVAPGYPNAGRWTLPGGGVDWGEHPEQTMRRELYEETGLEGEIEELLGIDSTCYEPNDYNGYTSLHMVRIMFRVTASGSPKVTELDGSTVDAAWLPISKIDSLPTVQVVALGLAMAGRSR